MPLASGVSERQRGFDRVRAQCGAETWGAEDSHTGVSFDTAPGHGDEPQSHTRLELPRAERIQGSGATVMRFGLFDKGTGDVPLVTPGL